MTKSPRPIETFWPLTHLSSSSLEMLSPSCIHSHPAKTRNVEQRAATDHKPCSSSSQNMWPRVSQWVAP